jgi:hypothetical protein
MRGIDLALYYRFLTCDLYSQEKMRRRKKASSHHYKDARHIWNEVRDTLSPEKPPKTAGRLAMPHRTVLDGILYILAKVVSGNHCQENMV